MAFDQKLRDGLQRETARVDPLVERGLQTALRRGRRHLLARRAAALGSIIGIGALLLLVGPRLLDGLSSRDAIHPGGSTSPSAPFSIDGLWQTRVVTRADEARALRAAGFSSADVRFFMHDQGAQRTDRYLISFDGSNFDTAGAPDGARPSEIDKGTFSIEGALLTFRYGSGGGHTTFRIHVQGDRMTLTLLEDTQPDYHGHPTEIPVIGIYTAAPFLRQG
jgi:hypothetical protein